MKISEIVVGGLYEGFGGSTRRRVVGFIKETPTGEVTRVIYVGADSTGAPFRDDVNVAHFLAFAERRTDTKGGA